MAASASRSTAHPRITPLAPLAVLTALLAAGAVNACGGGGGGGGPGPTPTTVKDLAYIRESRGILTMEPTGLKNLEVLVGTTRSAITKAASVDDSICQIRCALTSDKKRLVYLRTRQAVTDLLSVPVDNLVADLGAVTQVNERNHPLAYPVFYLVPGSDKVVFGQIETFGGAGADGGQEPPTFSVASASAAGGTVAKYRIATFLQSSPIAVTPDGKKIIFGETVGAASQLNLYVFDVASPNPSTRPIFQFMQEGSAEFGGEVMTLSPDGSAVFVATQVMGEKVIIKVTTDGRTQNPPPSRRIGPVECQTAGDNEICLILTDFFPSTDASKLFFLGGRMVGAEIVTQFYAFDTNLQAAPKALTNFTTEVLTLSMNRARNRVIWATEAEQFRKSNAIFAADFNGTALGTPTKTIDDTNGGISFHYQDGYFLE